MATFTCTNVHTVHIVSTVLLELLFKGSQQEREEWGDTLRDSGHIQTSDCLDFNLHSDGQL